MDAEYITLTRTNPITSRRTRPTRHYSVSFADLEGAVFSVFEPTADTTSWSARFSTEHLSVEGKRAFTASDPTRPVMRANTREELLNALAAYVDTYAFEQARHAWQMAEVMTFGIPAPYRIVRTRPWEYQAVVNDPRRYVMTIENADSKPVYLGGHVIAEAVKHSRRESGSWSGWIITNKTDGNWGDPIKNIPEMLVSLRAVADTIVTKTASRK